MAGRGAVKPLPTQPQFFRYSFKIRGLTIAAPFVGPVRVTLTQ